MNQWKSFGYDIVLIYFWLNSTSLAIKRIKDRVSKGGHFAENNVVKRRYLGGIKKLFDYYIPSSDYWIVVDNSQEDPIVIAEGIKDIENEIFNEHFWAKIKKIFLGIKLAIEELINSRAKENDFLIVSKKRKIVKISAKDLVKNKI